MNNQIIKASVGSELSVRIFNSDRSIELNEVDRSIIENATYATIESLERNEVLRRVNEWTKTLPVIIGLKQKIDEPTQVVIADYLKTYYKKFTFAEVMYAFDLLVTKELDEFIKEDDKKQFQMFSVDYMGNVLRAYRRKKNIAVHTGYKLLDLKEEKKEDPESTKRILDSIISLFDEYKKTKVYNESIVRPLVAFRVLSSIKGIVRLPISDSHIESALKVMETRIKSKAIHESLVWQFKREGRSHSHVIAYANGESMKESVTMYFDELIKGKQKLELKWEK